jgi:outer membrane murein-binding lipoprotein Lpp
LIGHWTSAQVEDIELVAGPASTERLMEARIARLESDVAHLRTDVGDIKTDVRSLRDKMDAMAERFDAKFDACYAPKLAPYTVRSPRCARLWMYGISS